MTSTTEQERRSQFAEQLKREILNGPTQSWEGEAFWLPIVMFVFSVVAETVSIVILEHGLTRISGEPVRAGGAVLALLLLFSAFKRLSRWYDLINRARGSLDATEQEDHTQNSSTTWILALIVLYALLTVLLSIASAFTEQSWPDTWGRIAWTVGLFLLNVTMTFAAFTFCRLQLYAGSEKLMSVHEAIVNVKGGAVR